jgi:hypothetical protein
MGNDIQAPQNGAFASLSFQLKLCYSWAPSRSERCGEEKNHKLKKNNLCGFSPQANYNDRATAACRRSLTVPHGRYLDFLYPEPLLLHSSSSSVILMRLSGPRSGPATSQ